MYKPQRLPPHPQYAATLHVPREEVENRKMLLTFTALQQTVDMFLRTL